MAYCDRCGAYIPDGQKVCLACGFDPEEESRQAQQAAAAQARYERQKNTERTQADYEAKRAAAAQIQRERQERYEREQAERRRAERQAYDKAWAENEKRRRLEEEEFRRQQEEAERRAESYVNAAQTDDGGVRVYVDPDGTRNVRIGDKVHVVVNPDGTKNVRIGNKKRKSSDADVVGQVERGMGKAGEKVRDFVNSDAFNKAEESFSSAGGKILPLISYLGPLCFLSLIVGEDDFTKFHAKQGLKLFIASAVLEALGSFFGVGFAVGIFSLLMSVIGIKNVINGEKKPLPYIGNKF